jgi:pyruvate dehydrogenase E1 component beta subunit
MQPAPCPTAKALEDLYYPDVRDIVSDVASLLDKDIELPPKQSMTDFYKHFKGPF